MESNTEHETAARHLWLDVLREAEKDNQYHKTTDFAGAFRQFDNFYLWLCLHKYVPGMTVYRYSPVEPFSAKNCELKAEPIYKSLAVQAAELAEYEKSSKTRSDAITRERRPGMARQIPRSRHCHHHRPQGHCAEGISEGNRL